MPPRTRSAIPIVLLLALAIALWLERARLHFDPHTLATQLRQASLPRILLGVAIIYACYWLRAWRWAVLLAPIQRVPTRALLPWQILGFTLVGLFGRVTDLARPWLTARHTGTPFATQLAIYSIERAFDLGAAALLFATALAFAPASMPHHEAFARTGISALAATLLIALAAAVLRTRGDRAASLARRTLTPVSSSFAAKAAARLLDFQSGLRAISSAREFLLAAALSLLMWIGIAATYVCCTRAFTACPQLASLSLAATMLLMATSMGGSLIQLPLLGWFTQTAVLAAALHGFFAVPLETATACGAVLQVVLNLSIVPVGLLVAQHTGTGLRAAARSASAAA